jgi:hypothetical protein
MLARALVVIALIVVLAWLLGGALRDRSARRSRRK